MHLSITARNTRGSIRGLNGLAQCACYLILTYFKKFSGSVFHKLVKHQNLLLINAFWLKKVKLSTVHTGFINLIYMNPCRRLLQTCMTVSYTFRKCSDKKENSRQNVNFEDIF